MKTTLYTLATLILFALPMTVSAEKLKCGAEIKKVCGEVKGDERKACAEKHAADLPKKCVEKVLAAKKERKENRKSKES